METKVSLKNATQKAKISHPLTFQTTTTRYAKSKNPPHNSDCIKPKIIHPILRNPDKPVKETEFHSALEILHRKKKLHAETESRRNQTKTVTERRHRRQPPTGHRPPSWQQARPTSPTRRPRRRQPPPAKTATPPSPTQSLYIEKSKLRVSFFKPPSTASNAANRRPPPARRKSLTPSRRRRKPADNSVDSTPAVSRALSPERATAAASSSRAETARPLPLFSSGSSDNDPSLINGYPSAPDTNGSDGGNHDIDHYYFGANHGKGGPEDVNNNGCFGNDYNSMNCLSMTSAPPTPATPATTTPSAASATTTTRPMNCQTKTSAPPMRPPAATWPRGGPAPSPPPRAASRVSPSGSAPRRGRRTNDCLRPAGGARLTRGTPRPPSHSELRPPRPPRRDHHKAFSERAAEGRQDSSAPSLTGKTITTPPWGQKSTAVLP